MKTKLLVLLALCTSLLFFITGIPLAQEDTCDRLFLDETYPSIPHEIVKTVNVVNNSYLVVDALYMNNTRDVKIAMAFIDSSGNSVEEVLTENRAFLEHVLDSPDTITIYIRPWNINQANVSLDIHYENLCPPIINLSN